jgi:hypothetical protein
MGFPWGPLWAPLGPLLTPIEASGGFAWFSLGDLCVNSTDFVSIFRCLTLGHHSFDVGLPFTRLLIRETLDLLSWYIEEDILRPFHHIVTFSYTFGSQSNECTYSMALGSVLFLVIASLYREEFEDMALEWLASEPVCWLWYMDDSVVIWPLRSMKVKGFLDCTKCTSEYPVYYGDRWRQPHIPFLDLNIYRMSSGYQGHEVYCKTVHTRLCLNSCSHHRPSNKHTILSILVHRAKALCK